jgi:hypothetical protein
MWDQYLSDLYWASKAIFGVARRPQDVAFTRLFGRLVVTTSPVANSIRLS